MNWRDVLRELLGFLVRTFVRGLSRRSQSTEGGSDMNELARAIVLICRVLEAKGMVSPIDAHAEELRALYLTLLRRGESATDYHFGPRGQDNLRALEEDARVKELFPPFEPTPLPQKQESR